MHVSICYVYWTIIRRLQSLKQKMGDMSWGYCMVNDSVMINNDNAWLMIVIWKQNMADMS